MGDRYMPADAPRLTITADFPANGDINAWQAASTPPVVDMADVMSALDDRLKTLLKDAR